MLSLFSTSSDQAGYRLQYMEVYNWGTFHNKVFKIQPQGNNSLLTGANASGKSTFIDALLTLLVPLKKDRFYNQSSGVEKKGDRTEETYVLGHYGTIQEEGKTSSSTQKLREKEGTYSVILASFANTDQKVITIFQVRWFSGGELKRSYGIAKVPLSIEKDFRDFDGKGNWKKRLQKTYNSDSHKTKIEIGTSPTAYAERVAQLLGMRSTKALSLFNLVVGVKILEDLDQFIRANMLEEKEAETEFQELRKSFETLTDAKVNIEKAKEQIAQLRPIHDLAEQLGGIQQGLTKLNRSQELGLYWFAEKNATLAQLELTRCETELSDLKSDLDGLRDKESELKNQETDLVVQIKSDEVGKQIESIKAEIGRLTKSRELRAGKLEDYNQLASSVKLPVNPGEETFIQNRETTQQRRAELEVERQEKDETLRQAKNKRDDLQAEIEDHRKTIETLLTNKNNISGRVAAIRDEILAHIGASKEEIPFIGELVKVREEASEWERAAEKILHNFALRLIVPEAYFAEVNAYVNRTNLRGRIMYQRYQSSTSLKSILHRDIPQNALIRKLTFKPKSHYSDWLEEVISTQFNYACVSSITEFNSYDKYAVTKEGLIKYEKGKHEKDDRKHILKKEHYVLGWDNKDKIKLLRLEVKKLQDEEKLASEDIRHIEQRLKEIDTQKEVYFSLFDRYKKYDDIDWQTYATQIQEKNEQKSALEKTNDRVKTLQQQLTNVKQALKTVSDIEIQGKNRDIYRLETTINTVTIDLRESVEIVTALGQVDTEEFEQQNPALLGVPYARFKETQTQFQQELSTKRAQLDREKQVREREVTLKINAFKQPPEEITQKFKDWRRDVLNLPDSTHLDLIEAYQKMLQALEKDGLPKFEARWNDLLQSTITDKIGSFRVFFTTWEESIKDNIAHLNHSLKQIDFKENPRTYIQLIANRRVSDEVAQFRSMLDKAIPNIRELDSSIDGRKNHFVHHIEPFIAALDQEEWRKRVMEVRSWFTYRAEEFYQENETKFKTYENMGQLSGGEKAQLTYTILGSAIAYQFGLTKEGLQSNSFRFIAIDEAFKAQDEDKARYLVTLCKQLHLQLLVVTPSDNIHIVENDISFVHFVERQEEKISVLYDMPIEKFLEERANAIDS